MKTPTKAATAQPVAAIKNVPDENLAACKSEVIDLRSVQPKMFRDAIRVMSLADLKMIWVPYFKSLREIPAELFVGLMLDACDHGMDALESNAVVLLEVLPQRAYNSALHRNGVKSDNNRSYELCVAHTLREGESLLPGISADRRKITLPAIAFLYGRTGKKLLETQAGIGGSDFFFNDAAMEVLRTQELQVNFLNTWDKRHPSIRRYMLALVERSVSETYAINLKMVSGWDPLTAMDCNALAGYARMNPAGAVRMIAEYPALTEAPMGFNSRNCEMVQVDTDEHGKRCFHTARMSYSNMQLSGSGYTDGYPVAILMLISAINAITGLTKPELVPGYKTLCAAIRKLPPVENGKDSEFEAGTKSRIKFAHLVASQIAFLGNFDDVLSILIQEWRGFAEAISSVEGVNAVYDFMVEHRHRLCIPGKARSTAESNIRETVKLAFRAHYRHFPELGWTEALINKYLDQREEKPNMGRVGELYGMRSPSYNLNGKYMDRVRSFMRVLMAKDSSALSPRVGKVRKQMGWLAEYLRSIDVYLDHCLKHANPEGVRALYALDPGACFLSDHRNSEWHRRSAALKNQLLPLVPKMIYVLYPQFAQGYTAKILTGKVAKAAAGSKEAFDI